MPSIWCNLWACSCLYPDLLSNQPRLPRQILRDDDNTVALSRGRQYEHIFIGQGARPKGRYTNLSLSLALNIDIIMTWESMWDLKTLLYDKSSGL